MLIPLKKIIKGLKRMRSCLSLAEIPIMHLHFAPAGFILINLIQIKANFCQHVIIVFVLIPQIVIYITSVINEHFYSHEWVILPERDCRLYVNK